MTVRATDSRADVSGGSGSGLQPDIANKANRMADERFRAAGKPHASWFRFWTPC